MHDELDEDYQPEDNDDDNQWTVVHRKKKSNRNVPSQPSTTAITSSNNDLATIVGAMVFKCPKCGFTIDRDLNVALNIFLNSRQELDMAVATTALLQKK